MSAEEDLIREIWRRWNTGERQWDPELFDAEAEVHSALTSGVFKGEEQILVWQDEIDQQFEHWEVSAIKIESLSNGRVLVDGTIKARGRGSGLDLDQPASWTAELRDGRLWRLRNFIGQGSAREAAEALGWDVGS